VFRSPAPVANPLLKGQERGLSRTSDLSLYIKVYLNQLVFAENLGI
jgi:hypothetical protein